MTEHYGYAGKILIVNLTDRTSQTIDTEPYIEWVGGHGMASKLFWDYCEDKTVEAVDPGNVLVFAATPFSGAVVPAASARCEFTGISPFSLPEWYNRSSMGGRLAGMMKEAGYDACVVRGKAEAPVWISVVNDQVTFNDATDLWGLDTFECQERIWEEVTHGTAPGSWYELTKGRDGGRTTQRPSVICIGPAGENLARVSCIVHDAGHVTGQSGFGAVFGAKNLKAMSFIGSKSIPIADPAALVRLRLEVQEKFGYDIDAGKVPGAPGSPGAASTVLDTSPTVSRAEGCRGCLKNCRNLYPGGVGNELTCSAGLYFTDSGKIDEQLAAYSLLSKLGLNGYEIDMPVYLHNLYKMGVMGKGKDIDTDLPFEQYGTYAFIEELLMRIAYRREIGDDLAEGIARAAQKWGRWDEDTSSGLLARPNWGYCEHNEPRAEVEWSYGSIFSERDINEHGVHNAVYNTSIMAVLTGAEPPVSAENMAKQLADQSGLGDPLCFDWSEEGIYSDARVREIHWNRAYGRFWLQSLGTCDWVWPNFISRKHTAETGSTYGATPEYEVKFFQAVTGRDLSYEESIELGHKFWVLDRAIWALEGRHRDQEVFTNYVYDVKTTKPFPLVVFEDGKWSYSLCQGRTLDRDKFEDFKTRFYAHEGFEESTGRPTRSGLEALDLGFAADKLEAAGKLGA